jgi:hypothetical protein
MKSRRRLLRFRASWRCAGLLVAALCAGVGSAAAQTSPLTVTLSFKDAPADATFDATDPATKITIVVQIENVSGGPVLTTEGFSSSDFFRRLVFTEPSGGIVINAAEAPIHVNTPVFQCLSRRQVLQPTALPVAPVEVLPGPGGTASNFFREYVIDDARSLYRLTRPGRYSVKAVVPFQSFLVSDGDAVIGDCDQFEGTTVVNVAAETGRQALIIESNALEFRIASPAPATLVLGPANASIPAGGSQTYAAEGVDASDNSLGDVTAGTTFAIAPDGSCQGANCSATVAGPHMVTATNGAAGGTASLLVSPGALDRVAISPASSSIPAGGSQAYTIAGLDAYSNPLGDVTGVSTLRIDPDGSCTGATCTAIVPGPHTVMASDGGKTTTASLLVSGTIFAIRPSSLQGRLVISPGDLITGGYSFRLTDGAHAATSYAVFARVTFPVTCPLGGGKGGTITLDLGTRTYDVPAGSTAWVPTDDATRVESWQASAPAPDLCGGKKMLSKLGASFTATTSQNPPTGSPVTFRFKYVDPKAKGHGNVNCLDTSDPRRNQAGVCVVPWSVAVTKP